MLYLGFGIELRTRTRVRVRARAWARVRVGSGSNSGPGSDLRSDPGSGSVSQKAWNSIQVNTSALARYHYSIVLASGFLYQVFVRCFGDTRNDGHGRKHDDDEANRTG